MAASSPWHRDWQDEGHVRLFDSRSTLADRALIGHYRAFSDVLLLEENLSRNPNALLLEVGCATGELSRYLRRQHPGTRYYGLDVSRAALERARQKYPKGRFLLHDPAVPLAETLRSAGLSEPVEVVYSKDVVHHQTDPFGFLGQMLDLASTAAVFRLRTRDRGETVLDPELSCQYHYNGWMPYLVLNLQETLDFVRQRRPQCQVKVQRNRMILGGKENRYLPKECYLAETGTAETTLAVWLQAERPGEIRIEDRRDMQFPLPWYARWKGGNGHAAG